MEYSDEIASLVLEREQARERKDWELSDKIRKKISTLGINIHDKKFNA